MKAWKTSPRRTNPAGFTLIELLVVIAIIGVLVGLLLGGVMKVRDVGNRTKVVSELNNLNMACTKFKTDFGFYPPDRVRLPGQVPKASWAAEAVGTPARDTYDGYQLILRMFPRWQIPGVGAAAAAVETNPGQSTGISVRGTAVPAEGLVLQGSQCLVFFLGGPDLLGFKPSGPYTPDAGATAVKAPQFEFTASRLNPSTDPQHRFGYLDPYGTPYAYFSTFSGRSYTSPAWEPPGSRDATQYVPNTPTPAPPHFAINPYFESASKPVNASGVQIISAGKNKKFGPGGVWVPNAGVYVIDAVSGPIAGPPAANGTGNGGDDLANFNGGLQLGTQGN